MSSGWEAGMGTRGETEAAGLGMQQQLPGGSDGDGICPGLVDLLDQVQLVTLGRMETDRIELHPLEHGERIAGLRCDPVVHPRGRGAHGVHEPVRIVDGVDDDAGRGRVSHADDPSPLYIR